jgi:hypothetical protein
MKRPDKYPLVVLAEEQTVFFVLAVAVDVFFPLAFLTAALLL